MSEIVVNDVVMFISVAITIITKAPGYILKQLIAPIGPLFTATYENIWDLGIFLVNVLTPPLKKGTVVKPGKPGYQGIWPEFIAPKETDSRSPCPYLNAYANHGILPRDGRNIDLKVLPQIIYDTLNCSLPFGKNVCEAVTGIYGRSIINLDDLSTVNLIEHDASILRHDHYFVEDRTKPAKDLIEKFLATASGPRTAEHPEGSFTIQDVSRFLDVRHAHSKKYNPHYSMNTLQRFFGASNSALLYEIVKGDVAELRYICENERFPDGWETRVRHRAGYSMLEFHTRALQVWIQRSFK